MSIREEFSKSIGEIERLLDQMREQDPSGYEAAAERLQYTAGHYPHAADSIEIGRLGKRSACLTQWGPDWVIDIGGIIVWIGRRNGFSRIIDLKTLYDNPEFDTLWSREVFSRLDEIGYRDSETAARFRDALTKADREEKQKLLAEWFELRQKSRDAVRRLLAVSYDPSLSTRFGEAKDPKALEVQRLTNTVLMYLTTAKGYRVQAQAWHHTVEVDGYFELHYSLYGNDGEVNVPFHDYSSTDQEFENEWDDKKVFIKVHQIYWHVSDYDQSGVGFRLALRYLIRNNRIDEDLTEELRDKINEAIKELDK